jgi:D-alanyl-D-alanine carboxypeptidase
VELISTLRTSTLLAALAAASFTSPAFARHEAALLIEADTGNVLLAENATAPWYPASVTKLMTTYVTLQAVKNGRLTLDSLLLVSARASAQNPTKMGFRPGVRVTVDNALKMLLVKSANDIAVVLAEGVSGSVETFADEMNQTSRKLGMTQSAWVNPNGLPADGQITSARDLAILARALWHDFPEYDLYWHIPAIQFGKRVVRNYNTLIGRYEGADGMKTGFICASGFNLVASATRNGKRLIAVVLGSPSSPYRAAKAAGLLERGFNRGALSWLTPTLGAVETLQPINAAPPDLRDEMCGSHRKRPAAEEADSESDSSDTPLASLLSALPPGSKGSGLLSGPAAVQPIVVFAGPPKKPAASQFASIRNKIGKGGKKGQPPAEPATPAVQTAAAPPLSDPAAAGPFGPPTGHPSWMSFAPAARADTAPLTATPDARPGLKLVSVPIPRPRPKIAVAAKRKK